MKKLSDERETGMSQIGYCIYCGQATQIPVEKEATPEQLNKWATERCNCDRAKIQQDWESTKNQSETYIDSLFGGEYPELAKMLTDNVRNCFAGNFDKITVKVGETTAVMKRKETDSNVRIEICRTDTIKSTRTVEK